MKEHSGFVEKNLQLVKEFDRYVLEHPDFAEKIPDNALIVMNIEGDEEFNNWARKTAESVAEADNQIVYVNIIDLKPVRSRITKLDLRMAA
ncbi:MAG: DUF5647 family protein [Desulfomonilaceae bacterium]